MLAVHVDDGLGGNKPGCAEVWTELQQMLTFGEWKELRTEQKFLGRRMRQDDEGVVIDLNQYPADTEFVTERKQADVTTALTAVEQGAVRRANGEG